MGDFQEWYHILGNSVAKGISLVGFGPWTNGGRHHDVLS